ncbi:MAG: nuclear transport factor 2 family protein [Beijerinckiaceae bacterium]|nr:nuclear transport factor 2 family protein [Beijerinckiaceae bacterium]
MPPFPAPEERSTGVTIEERLAHLEDEAAIRALLASYGRAIDRGDSAMLAGLFHADAQIHYGADVFEGCAGQFVAAVLAIQAAMVRTHHMSGQSLIVIRGETAWAETYGQATHVIDQAGRTVEFSSGGRYLDRLEKREGSWRIAHRQVVSDWLRELPADESLFSRLQGPPRGQRGQADPSAYFFPA